ncbi:hypothetical protein SCOR_31270 [Sulfidibacter corallicola]|uniref:Uncharacterized protein n=1 Tax=Sulfidibacter corallicola TaxID=2818388 RepID=A0A8A4TM55_SULCO|nr:hypothetical protein [Sulfidibacter corallicola]QTD49968.1 hypothetical protein J3U87_30670 [Sulfidibacter corallicola]
MVERIFAEDEMELSEVDPQWDSDTLLNQRSIFYLKDVVGLLKLDPLKVKRRAGDLLKREENPWHVMGVRKMWTHWVVRMAVFAPYYRQHFKSKIVAVDPAWNGNLLLQQRGLFLLTAVCKLIPFSPHQLRYRAKKNPDAKTEYGIWKDPDLNAFVVDMEIFSGWVRTLWNGDFN